MNKKPSSTAQLVRPCDHGKILRMSSFRLPQSLGKRLGVETGDTVFRHELLHEQAASLAQAGRKVDTALEAPRAHMGEGRAELVKAAADAVWGFLVQREILGLRDRAAVVAQYGIPGEVINRIGAR